MTAPPLTGWGRSGIPLDFCHDSCLFLLHEQTNKDQQTTRSTTTQDPMSDETPRRTIRIPNHRWQAAKTRADDQGTTISEVVNNYLEEYGHPMNPPGTQQQP